MNVEFKNEVMAAAYQCLVERENIDNVEALRTWMLADEGYLWDAHVGPMLDAIEDDYIGYVGRVEGH